MKYRKKPVVIETIQWTGNNIEEIFNFMGKLPEYMEGFKNKDEILGIQTLEGLMVANIGYWIIKGVKGEFYPCKPDIFEATYEAVN
jgi:hypothetical protein